MNKTQKSEKRSTTKIIIKDKMNTLNKEQERNIKNQKPKKSTKKTKAIKTQKAEKHVKQRKIENQEFIMKNESKGNQGKSKICINRPFVMNYLSNIAIIRNYTGFDKP